jgi:hypothetical protein
MSGSNEKLRTRYAEDPEYRERKKASSRAYREENRVEINALRRQKRASDPELYEKERVLAAQRRRKAIYGLNAEDYDQMLSRQNGACAICKLTFQETPCVDHCHATHVVRGLLCTKCNIGLGNFNDDPSLLRAAAAYLEAARSLPKPRCVVPAGSPANRPRKGTQIRTQGQVNPGPGEAGDTTERPRIPTAEPRRGASRRCPASPALGARDEGQHHGPCHGRAAKPEPTGIAGRIRNKGSAGDIRPERPSLSSTLSAARAAERTSAKRCTDKKATGTRCAGKATGPPSFCQIDRYELASS